MARTGPKGPPLFDVLASRRREPSALEVALQAALDERLVDASAASTDPDSPNGAGVAPEAEAAHAPAAGGTSYARSLWAVALDDEPPLTDPTSATLRSADTGAGPRIAAFAAATGAAVRRPASPTASTADPGEADASDAEADALSGRPDPVPTGPASEPDAGPVEGRPRDGATDQSAASRTATEVADPTPASSQPGSAAPAAVVNQPDPAGDADTWADTSAASAASSDPVVEVDEDDFGPLLVPEEPRRRHGIRSRPNPSRQSNAAAAAQAPAPEGDVGAPPPRRMGRRLGIALGTSVLALLGLAAWRVIPSDTAAAVTGSTAQAPAVDGTGAPSAGQPTSDVVMVPWHGIALPVSATSGPRVQGATASGFEHSALGAAIAAANLLVRVDPQAGASVFEPTLATQVVGDAERLSQAVRDQADSGSGDGASPGRLIGWRIDSDPTGGQVVVHLAVDDGTAAGLDFAVPLAWVDGDWRIDAAASGLFFPTTALSGDYIPFVQEGSAS